MQINWSREPPESSEDKKALKEQCRSSVHFTQLTLTLWGIWRHCLFPFPQVCRLEDKGLLDVGVLLACLLCSAVQARKVRKQVGRRQPSGRGRNIPGEEWSSHLHNKVDAHLMWEVFVCWSLAEVIATDRKRHWAQTKACVTDRTSFLHCGAWADGAPLIRISKHLRGAHRATPHWTGSFLSLWSQPCSGPGSAALPVHQRSSVLFFRVLLNLLSPLTPLFSERPAFSFQFHPHPLKDTSVSSQTSSLPCMCHCYTSFKNHFPLSCLYFIFHVTDAYLPLTGPQLPWSRDNLLSYILMYFPLCLQRWAWCWVYSKWSIITRNKAEGSGPGGIA